MTLIQALFWNAGSLNKVRKGKPKQEVPARSLPIFVQVADEPVVALKLL